MTGDKVFLRRLVDGLRTRGHEVEIVSPFTDYQFRLGQVSARRLVTEALAIRRRMKRFAPDAWLIYNPTRGAPDLFGWWQRPKRYVLLTVGLRKGGAFPRRWRWLFIIAHGQSLARADTVTVPHPRRIPGLALIGVPREKLLVLPLASSTPDSIPPREEARRRLGLPPEAPVILCVSRLTVDAGGPGKTGGVIDLLAALATLPRDVVLVLVGDGPGRRQVQEAAAGLEPEGRVRLVGAVDYGELRWFYAACDLLAYADPVDVPRLSILEAQAYGRPVVVMRTRATQLTVDDGRTGLLASDPAQFREHLAALASDRARCASMGEAAREYIAAQHSMEARVRQVEGLLQRGPAPIGRLAGLVRPLAYPPLGARMTLRMLDRRAEPRARRRVRRRWRSGRRTSGFVGRRMAYLARAVREGSLLAELRDRLPRRMACLARLGHPGKPAAG